MASGGMWNGKQVVPKEWVAAYEEALSSGKPEPYGKNSNLIYKEMSSPMDQMFYDHGP